MEVAGIEIKRGRRRSAAGVELAFTIARVAPSVRPRLCLDERFYREGIVFGGSLLDVAATEALWHAPVGRRPEEWLRAAPAGAIAFCPTNWGWQRGAWLFEGEQVYSLAGDSPDGQRLWALGWSAAAARGWRGLTGVAAEIQAMLPRVALEMPRLVRAGAAVPLAELLGHPRLRADFRNVFDFADGRGRGLPPEFWVLLRKVLPHTAEAGRILLHGGDIAIPLHTLAASEAEHLLGMLREERLSRVSPGVDSLVLHGPFPLARIPVFALGARPDGTLIVVALEGRRAGTPGATLEEAADFLVREGVESGGLGSAGGDVALVRRTESGTELVGIPSSRAAQGGAPVSRRVPGVLLFSP
ncbi:MAG: hypothetical protein VCC00_07510 [Deltaproteobacteria bacterium]